MAARIETVSQITGQLGYAIDALIQDVTAIDGVPPVGEHKYLKLHNGADSARAVLAWDGDRLVGYAQLLLAESLAIAEVVVCPTSRRRGIGRQLLTTVDALARKAGATRAQALGVRRPAGQRGHRTESGDRAESEPAPA